ncbi:MAG: restriction endonuclease subunit S [Lachnospiraceae bacterium]|nr:restriction endonuclease subunit S [Lachnospiraceae bacterium]
MIDTEALRKKVIELAIQGKLTEQLPSDGDAESLYAQILEEKAKLTKEGKIRKDKDLPPISDDEIPFDKPVNWLFVRFSSIITLQSGQDLNATDYNADGNGIPYITGASNYRDDGTLIINRWTDVPRAFANRGDILLSCKGTVGKLTILDEDEVHIARQIMGIRTYSVNVRFIKYFVDWMLEVIKSASKGLIPGIERNDILNLCCPLPPLSEQARIVDKIEDVLAQIDIIDTLQQQYESDLSVLKGKIIDAGIRGKLTEQLPEDGDAEDLFAQIQEEKARLIKEGKIKKEKPLPEIDADEIPFEIPKNWKWVRLGDVARVYGGKRIPAGRSLTAEDTGHKYIRVSDMKNGTVITDNLLYVPEDIYPTISRYIINKEDVYITVAGTIGKVGKIPPEIDGVNLTENADRIVFKFMNQDWLLRCLSASMIQRQIEQLTTQVAQPKLAIKRIQEFMLPMPPIPEQNRIVEKIDKVLVAIS